MKPKELSAYRQGLMKALEIAFFCRIDYKSDPRQEICEAIRQEIGEINDSPRRVR